MGIRDYLSIVRKYLWLIGLGALLGLAAGVLLGRLLGWFPLYSATATVIVGGDVAAVEQNSDYTTLGDQFVETFADLATRHVVLQRVIDELGLDTSTDELSGQVGAEIVEQTQLIEITASNSDAETAAAIANSIARQLVALPSLRVRDFVLPVEEAAVPTDMDRLWLLAAVVATVLGVLLVGGLAFLFEFMKDAVYSAEELTQRANLPVLTTVRRGANRRRTMWRMPSWRKVSQNIWWPLVQVCRYRFGELELPTNPHPPKPRILVASPTGGDDKALVATNLAVAWAKSGSRVILVDADLQSPSLHKWFKAQRGPGLADVLYESDEDGDTQKRRLSKIHQALQPTATPLLTLVAAGDAKKGTKGAAASDGPSFHLLSPVLDELAANADVVVLNGPPLLTTAEGPMVAAQAHGIILTVRVGKTRMSDVSDAQDTLAMIQGNLFGTILTEVN
jgi:capsular polysaccharide biosynthesis protein/cellulose biosynthesis protein BcsQ